MNLAEKYRAVRKRTEDICAPLKTEDYVLQPVVYVSPPKWHLGHTSWFFEAFILRHYQKNYKAFDPNYNFVFNSYYETIGARVIRTDRGNLSRPAVADIYRYRKHVDDAMLQLLEENTSNPIAELTTLGLNHEEQHQELLWTDIKYILGNNPLFPAYDSGIPPIQRDTAAKDFISIPAGIYEIGYVGTGFCYDNELGRHIIHLPEFSIATDLITNREFMEFINDGGYHDHRHWHLEGLEWVKENKIDAPMYWYRVDDQWHNYTLAGLQPVQLDEPVCHISFYEAAAYASWRGMRLPTEYEWETAALQLNWGRRWEWTNSAYLPYPGYKKADGALGEYNGKFMINQMVLRGESDVTSPGHSRMSYRNFFHPHLRWQYTGIRLAK